MTRADYLYNVLYNVLIAIDEAKLAGCIDHLNYWDEAKQKWYRPLDRAKEAVLYKGDYVSPHVVDSIETA